VTIRSNNPRIDIEALRKRVAEEMARMEEPEKSMRVTKLALELHLQSIEQALEVAEARSVPRTTWPENLNVFPFSLSPKMRALALKVLALATRDQQEVNAALIRSQRETIALIKELLVILSGAP
jgi:O-antigen chain-terminating methyltransferase